MERAVEQTKETQNNAAARKKIFETQTRVVQYGDQIPVMGGDRPQQGDETRRDETRRDETRGDRRPTNSR